VLALVAVVLLVLTPYSVCWLVTFRVDTIDSKVPNTNSIIVPKDFLLF